MKKTLLTLTLYTCLSSHAFAQAPIVNLIPVTAQESIKQSSEAAVEMRSVLGAILQEIENQKSLWDAAKCDGMVDDPGCSQIQSRLTEAYKDMLVHLEDKLPALSQKLSLTATSIEKRLHKELGKKMTLDQIQELLRGKTAEGKRRLSARTSNNSVNMLQWLQKMSQAISSGGYAEAEALVASDIYINMTLATEQIESMQANISQTLATIDTYTAFDGLSDSQLQTVESVKGLLFGEVDMNNLPAQPQHSIPEARSSLDLGK